jgi:beta-RFAP synthase
MSKTVHVHAPCRLHFGLFSFGHSDRPQFGGVGVMIDPPAVEVTITPAGRFAARGDLPSRVEHFVDLLVQRWELDTWPACEIRVQAPRDHTGLGVGTQLGLSVGAGLRRFLELPPLEACTDLAIAVGRAARSAVGTYGFWSGGLIVDGGKEQDERFTGFMRQAIPANWRFVLCCDRTEQGLAGNLESDAFTRLPPVPDEVASELRQIAFHEMTRAAVWADCGTFGDALYRYGLLAGECFSAVQGGPYASPEIARRVELIRSWGVPGVGQSSWGPSVFALTDNDDEAIQLADRLRGHPAASVCEITIARPSNEGASFADA